MGIGAIKAVQGVPGKSLFFRKLCQVGILNFFLRFARGDKRRKKNGSHNRYKNILLGARMLSFTEAASVFVVATLFAIVVFRVSLDDVTEIVGSSLLAFATCLAIQYLSGLITYEANAGFSKLFASRCCPANQAADDLTGSSHRRPEPNLLLDAARFSSGYTLVSLRTPNAPQLLVVSVCIGQHTQTLPVEIASQDPDQLSVLLDMHLGGRAAKELLSDQDGTVPSSIESTIAGEILKRTIGVSIDMMSADQRQSFDANVKALLCSSFHRVKQMLSEHKESLRLLTEALLKTSTLSRGEVLELLQAGHCTALKKDSMLKQVSTPAGRSLLMVGGLLLSVVVGKLWMSSSSSQLPVVPLCQCTSDSTGNHDRTIELTWNNITTLRASSPENQDATATSLEVTLIQSKKSPDSKCRVENGDWSTVDVHAEYEWGSTLLDYCAAEGDLEAVSEVLTRGALKNHVDVRGMTALKYAAQHGHFKVVDLLLNATADVKAGAGSSALFHSIDGRHEKVAIRIIHAYEDGDAASLSRELEEAMRKKMVNLLQYVRKRFPVEDSFSWLRDCNKFGGGLFVSNPETMQFLVEEVLVASSWLLEDTEYCIALVGLCYGSHPLTVQEYVLKAMVGSGPSEATEEDILACAEFGNKEVTQVLAMDCRFDLGIVNEEGKTPRMLAAENGHMEVFDFLGSVDRSHCEMHDTSAQ